MTGKLKRSTKYAAQKKSPFRRADTPRKKAAPKSKKTNQGGDAVDAALDLNQYQISWINWDDPEEVFGKTIATTRAFILGCKLEKMLPNTARVLRKMGATVYQEFHEVVAIFHAAKQLDLRRATEFIVDAQPADIKLPFENYQATVICAGLTEFVLQHRPCCQLRALAWLIPNIPFHARIIPIVSYAARLYAELINNRAEPYAKCCVEVGNSWLHQLGIYLMHHCADHDIPTPRDLIQLLSVVTPPPLQGAKAGKAARMFNYLVDPPQPEYMHEMSAARAVGYMLTLELLGEIDSNHQEKHYRRIERAVGYCAMCRMNGNFPPSVKSLQEASGLSWADAKEILNRPYFGWLTFEYECRYLTYQAWPEKIRAENEAAVGHKKMKYKELTRRLKGS
jgi:hypothetical protein